MRVLILGIGNVLWADEGFGVRCVEVMAETHALPDTVRLLDGGTQGLYLLPFLEEADALIVFDAIDYGLPPGTMKVVRDGEVPAFMGAKKMSLHQTGFQEVLMLAQLTGHYPAEVLLIGCQPEELEDYGGSLRPKVRLAVDDALALALDRLRAWGARPVPRDLPPDADEAVTVPTLSLQAYEAGRPDAALACRIGDERFMPPAARSAAGA